MNSLNSKKLLNSKSMKFYPQEPLSAPLKKSKTIQSFEDLKKKVSFRLPEMFYVDTKNPETLDSEKISLKTRLSVLSEFGILPGKGLKIFNRHEPKNYIEASIKLSDVIGKKNARAIFKSLDLESILNSARTEDIEEGKVKRMLLNNRPNVLVNIKSGEYGRVKYNSPVLSCRKIMTANSPRDIGRRSEDIEKLDTIYRSCDQLKEESKRLSKDLKRISLSKV